MSALTPRDPAATDPGTGPSSGSGEDVVVQLSGVSHAYARTPALRGLSLSVAAGEVVAITGPSGCGKSTALHIAAGLLRPQTGRATLLGHDLLALDEADRARLRRREVGIVLQFGQLVPDLPVLDNVALPLLLEGGGADAARTAAADALARVGMDVHAGALPAELSGGQAQRVAVARALVTSPRVIFADEPIASLDAAGGRQVMALLTETTRARGGALVLVTHDNTAAALADREVRLREGAVEHEAVLR